MRVWNSFQEARRRRNRTARISNEANDLGGQEVIASNDDDNHDVNMLMTRWRCNYCETWQLHAYMHSIIRIVLTLIEAQTINAHWSRLQNTNMFYTCLTSALTWSYVLFLRCHEINVTSFLANYKIPSLGGFIFSDEISWRHIRPTMHLMLMETFYDRRVVTMQYWYGIRFGNQVRTSGIIFSEARWLSA